MSCYLYFFEIDVFQVASHSKCCQHESAQAFTNFDILLGET